MAKTKHDGDLNISTLHHLNLAILIPNQLDRLFYEGQVCPHGHRLRHRQLHWCFNCALNIYSNRCGVNINHIDKVHRFYFTKLFEGLDVPKNFNSCWELPDDRCGSNRNAPRFSYIHYGYQNTKRAISMPLARMVYSFFWGEVGSLTVSSLCRNPRCWNPLHVKSRFNVKPMPEALGPVDLQLSVEQMRLFDQQERSIEDERQPKIRVIKSPLLNKQVDPGSPFRPLESVYIPELE